jgi:pimeloyl-ACP methyl ester carboxylesterase
VARRRGERSGGPHAEVEGQSSGPGNLDPLDKLRRAAGLRPRAGAAGWAHPGGPTITLAVIRQRASRPRERLGTLFFNPGGPGVSGIDSVKDPLVSGLLDQAGGGRFDVVSWDTRGSGASMHVRCFRDERSARRFWGGLTVSTTAAASRGYLGKAIAYARRCGQLSGSLLSHISTADTARDLDYLRSLLHQRQLTYIGWSYGTFLGQTYANMFPHRVRAMVLDGVVDAVSYVRSREAFLENAVASTNEVFKQSASPTVSRSTRNSATGQ